MPQPKEKTSYALIMLLPMLLLAGCATQSTPSVVDCPQPPQMPVSRQQAPALPYSASARIDIEQWQKRLTDVSPTGKP